MTVVDETVDALMRDADQLGLERGDSGSTEEGSDQGTVVGMLGRIGLDRKPWKDSPGHVRNDEHLCCTEGFRIAGNLFDVGVFEDRPRAAELLGPGNRALAAHILLDRDRVCKVRLGQRIPV
ncbi:MULTISPECIES: hypothetical protein [Gordonia]|uniref:hypothetical protein n=1 Tax=Gordonia TaxID=2053 RepID=UPI001331B4C3|nr:MULTISPECIES: hypothetical protein [Gordonia]MCZ0911566.1 hypothetical protein [Gordonia amicalis]